MELGLWLLIISVTVIHHRGIEEIFVFFSCPQSYGKESFLFFFLLLNVILLNHDRRSMKGLAQVFGAPLLLLSTESQ